jgi:hypothetical protein
VYTDEISIRIADNMVGSREEATRGLKRGRFLKDETEGISHGVMVGFYGP